MKNRSNRVFFAANGVIAFAALLFRLIAGFQLYRFDKGVAEPALVTDMATYLNFAKEILAGDIPREFYYQPFYYSVFLPLVQLFTGQSIPAVIVAQSLCGAGAVYLAGLLGARIAGKKAGLAAAALLACSRIAIVYTPFALLETMQSFWLLLLLYVTFRAWEKNHLWQWLIAGIVLSFAILSRGNAWFLLPAVLLAVRFASRKKEHRGKFALLACGIVLLGTILPQIPFAAVNSAEYGRLRGPSTAGGNVLALGNSPEAPPGGLAYPETYQIWMEHEEEVSIPARIYGWAREEPLAFLELQFRKVLLFWNQEEIPNNINPAQSALKSPLMKALGFLPTGFIMTSALLCIFLGIGTMFRGKDHLLTAVLFVLLYNLAMAAFYNLARFRVPCVPLMCVLAGCGLVLFIGRFRNPRNRRRNILTALLALLLSWGIVYPGFDLYRQNLEPGIMRFIRPGGINVPNRSGGRLIYDNGPRHLGGWMPVRTGCLFKTFALEEPIPAGTPVTLSISLVRGYQSPVIGVNGVFVDLSGLRIGTIQAVKLKVPYPEDNIFRLEFSGELFPVLDFQRNYGRTFDKAGNPLNAELAASVSTAGKVTE